MSKGTESSDRHRPDARRGGASQASLARGILAILLAALVPACGAVKGRGHDDGSVEIEGTVSARGRAELGVAYLEATDGKVYILQQSNAAYEVRTLDGMDVRLRAIVLPETLRDMPILEVRSYELLALPTGERPIVGFIYAYPPDNIVYLVDKGGLIYHIGGDFRRTLMDYNGAKVWLAGDIGFSATRLHERGIDVRAYGIIADRGGIQF